MIAKKSKGADLEKKRFAFFQVGLITVSAMTLVAFEYASVNEEMKLAERYEPGPLISSAILFEPIEPDELPSANTAPAIPSPGGQQIIDTVTVVDTPIDPGKGIHIPVTPVVVVIGPVGPPPPPPDPIMEEPLVPAPDVEPTFPGGVAAMHKFTLEHIRYPEMPRELGVEGTVYVEFIVNKDGSISNVVAKNDIDPELAREAVRVVKLMPKWIPGEQAGKPVRTIFVYPMRFSIN